MLGTPNLTPLLLAWACILPATPSRAEEVSKPCSLGATLTAVVGRAPEWKLPPELDRELHEYWKTSPEPLEDKLTHTYQKVLAARVSSLRPASRFLVERAGRKLLERKGWYQRTLGRWVGRVAGPHYNPLFNRVFLQRTDSKLADVVIAIHEMEHVVDRNSNAIAVLGTVANMREVTLLFPTPFGALNRFAMESKAIGAQWELMQRIPESERLKLRAAFLREARERVLTDQDLKLALQGQDPEIARELEERLSRMNLEIGILDQVTERSLLYASLSKEEFIREMRELHGYTMKNLLGNHYGASDIRILFGVLSGFGFYEVAQALYSGDARSLQEGTRGILFADLRFYLTLIAAAMSEDDPPSGREAAEKR